MAEEPEQTPGSFERAAPRAILPSAAVHAAYPDVIESADPGLSGADAIPGSARSGALSLGLLLGHKWLILGIFALVSVATIPWIWLLVEPTYSATAVVRVSPVIPRIIFQTEDNTMVPLYQSYLNTQVSVIRSPTVLQRVLDKPAIQQTKWYAEQPRTWRSLLGASLLTPLERLGKSLSVRPRTNTELIDVSISTTSSKEAKLIVDTVVSAYEKYTDETSQQSDSQRFETLRSEQAALRKEIDGLVATRVNVSKRLGTIDLEVLRSQLATELTTLESQYAELQRQHAMTQWELESRQPAAEDLPWESEVLRPAAEDIPGENDGPDSDRAVEMASWRFSSDAEWRSLKAALENARVELDAMSLSYGELHPQMKQAEARVEHMQRLLAQREAQLTQEGTGGLGPAGPLLGGEAGFLAGETPEQRARRQEQALKLLQDEIQSQRAKVAEAGDVAQEIAQYEEDIQHKRELYESVRSRLQVLELEGKAPARISVAAQAIASSEPARDRRMLLTIMALGGAMMTAVAVAYLRATMDPKIREANDVRRTVRAPLLGQLPPLSTAQDFVDDRDALAVESLRMVRTTLLERLHGAGDRVVLITSPCGQAGKTSVAVGLARSLAHLGKKTLLVEADLRRPALSGILGVEPGVDGLAVLLGDAATDDRMVVQGVVPNLDVLLAGEKPAGFNPESLGNGVLAASLERWKKRYDFILLDSPPVLPVADARILAGQADGTIMVLRSSHCHRADAMRAFADISAAGGKLLGTVLVGVRPRSEAGYYYDYQADDDRARAVSETAGADHRS